MTAEIRTFTRGIIPSMETRVITPLPTPHPTSVLLLHFDGTNGSTSFPDASGHNNEPVLHGDVHIDTSQSVFGGASALFDGFSGFLTFNGAGDFSIGLSDFTIDFWVRFVALGDNQDMFNTKPLATEGPYPVLYKANTINTINYFVNGANRILGTTTAVVVDTWYHIALTRAAFRTRLFINGIQEGSTWVDGTDYQTDPDGPHIGVNGADLNSSFLNGYLDEYRVIKGYAAWTGGFTPPTSPYTFT